MTEARRRLPLLVIIGPGLLVAATGVGAGDLMTASFAGSKLGLAILWAVIVGAVLKFALNEGLARYQLATGKTLLAGSVDTFGKPVHVLFVFAYMIPWTYVVGSALMGACGVCAHALFGGFDDPGTGKIVYGAAHSLLALVLVRRGGFARFERLMSACIVLMFVTVVASAIAISPDWSAVAHGLVVPRIPDLDGNGLSWTVALLGGVGGTLTVLCYGYWIREHRRMSLAALRTCRIDLAVGYGMTALFGIAMVIVGSRLDIDGRGYLVVVRIADQLEEALGPVPRLVFLIGAWGAVFSSLLGVWQAVPFLFADLYGRVFTRSTEPAAVDENCRPFRVYQLGIAFVPMVGLFAPFETVQKVYAVVGAWFMPILALALLILLGRRRPGGGRNGVLATLLLVATLAFFTWAGVRQVLG